MSTNRNIALDLRHEIRARLVKGQSATVIEADLIERYGPRMVAAPPGDPLQKIAVVIALIAAMSGLGISDSSQALGTSLDDRSTGVESIGWTR